MEKPLNVFANRLGRANSNYTSFRDGHLIKLTDLNIPPSPLTELVHDSFHATVLSRRFPCIGAKVAVRQGQYRMGVYPEMDTPAATAGLAHDLFTFVQEQCEFGGDYSTFIASFVGPVIASELEFEGILWHQLQSLYDTDRLYHTWDSSVSSDPEDPRFSFSFAEMAFFVIGVHPVSSRWARRFAWPTLIFNPHAQFERLRSRGRYDRLQRVIREHDLDLQGSVNPALTDFGERSEASQYSGRHVEPDWVCPFHP